MGFYKTKIFVSTDICRIFTCVIDISLENSGIRIICEIKSCSNYFIRNILIFKEQEDKLN